MKKTVINILAAILLSVILCYIAGVVASGFTFNPKEWAVSKDTSQADIIQFGYLCFFCISTAIFIAIFSESK